MNEFNRYNENDHKTLPKDEKSKSGTPSLRSRLMQMYKDFRDRGKREAAEKALYEEKMRRMDEHIDRLNEKRIADSWHEYHKNRAAVKDGTFLVKEGDLVFRVVGGIKIGGHELPEVGGNIENLYATPHSEAVKAILSYNDEHQGYYDGMPFDRYQQIAVIKVKSLTIPEPDISYDPATDYDQMVVNGEIVEILEPNEFFGKYG